MWELNRPKNSEDNCFITYLSEIKKCGVSYLDNDSITIEKGKDSGKKDFRVRIRRILFCLIDLTALHPRLDFS